MHTSLEHKIHEKDMFLWFLGLLLSPRFSSDLYPLHCPLSRTGHHGAIHVPHHDPSCHFCIMI